MSSPLQPDENLADGLRRTLLERVSLVAALLDPGAGPADAAERAARVHASRKALKEVRAVLRMVEGAAPEAHRRTVDRAARDLGRGLAGARDAVVMRKTASSLGLAADSLGLPAEEPDQPWLPEVQAGLHGEASRLLALVQALALPQSGWGLVRAGLHQTWNGGHERYRRARRSGDAEDFHAWRTLAKARMYHQRLLAPAWPPVLGPVADELDRLQEVLGDHHDLHVLAAHLGKHAPATHAAAIDRGLAERQAELEGEALALGARLYGGTARGWERILRACWKAWRVA